jgi:hypothetical protein
MSVMGEPYQHRLEFLLNVVESLRIRTAFPMRPAFLASEGTRPVALGVMLVVFCV